MISAPIIQLWVCLYSVLPVSVKDERSAQSPDMLKKNRQDFTSGNRGCLLVSGLGRGPGAGGTGTPKEKQSQKGNSEFRWGPPGFEITLSH